MITPRVHKSKSSRRFAIVLTVVICALLYACMVLAAIPQSPPQPQEVFRQVDLELLPRIEPEVVEAEDVIDESAEDAIEEPEEVAPEPAEVSQAAPEPSVARDVPQKVDINLDDLMPTGLEVDLAAPSNPEPTRTRNMGGGGANTPRRIELEEGGELGGFDALKGLDSPAMPQANRPGTGSQGAERLKIDLAEGSGAGSGTDGQGGSLLGGGDVLGGPKGRDLTAGGSSVEVGMRDLESFGENYAEVDFKALVEWMRQNPRDLPVAVKQRMQRGNWDPSLLSSRVTFMIGDRSFDLLLMCKEELYEVHIMLVESVGVTYLIDRSFRQESNQLVTGTVRLGIDQDISVVSSRMRPASDQRNKEFYAIFLSWWDSVKDEI